MEKHDAVYLRVSTSSQDAENQRPDLERWLAAYGERPARWYADVGSGLNFERKNFARLMEDARAGHIDRLIVWRLDRLGRKPVEMLSLLEELGKLGVTFVSLRETIDMSQPIGRVVLGVLALFAAYEVEVKAERQAAGIARVRAENGGVCPWGGRREECATPEDKIQAIIGMHRLKMPQWQIARAVEVSVSTVQRTLAKLDRSSTGRRSRPPSIRAGC